jgi:hypothetical protein
MSSERHVFTIKSPTPPTVEIDYEAQAVYVRFKKTQVAKTISQPAEQMHVAVDLDSRNEVVGIEAVGLTSFSLQKILEKACVKAPQVNFSRAQIVPTGMIHA